VACCIPRSVPVVPHGHSCPRRDAASEDEHVGVELARPQRRRHPGDAITHDDDIRLVVPRVHPAHSPGSLVVPSDMLPPVEDVVFV